MAVFLVTAAAQPADRGAVAAARDLATTGKRAEALRALDARLASVPTDSDARTLRGIILSWDRRYDEARRDLETVLAAHRDYSDALLALINVELWSDHADRAEVLAREALRRNPNDAVWLVARAKALRALGQRQEALAALRRASQLDPHNHEAAEQARTLGDDLRAFTASFDHSSEWFSDKRNPWLEDSVQLSRQTGIGSVIARFSSAERFSSTSRQVELEAYPHLRPGTYAYLNFGYSPDAALYPRHRLGAELYQSLGKGWEASAGFRQLYFGSNINIYTPSLTKYYGNWMTTVRFYLTPGTTGTSRSAQIQARRYFGNGVDYWGVRCGYGASPVETQGIYDLTILHASTVAFEFQRTLFRRFSMSGRWGASLEDRIGASRLRHYLAEAGIYYRL
jgi:YaiO family outer membrane protein